MIAHIVLFEPKASITDEERRSFLATLRSAVRAVGSIRQARIGRVIGLLQMPETSLGQKPYSFAAIFEFESRQALAGYLEHPGHDPLREAFWNVCSATCIADVDVSDVDSETVDLLV